MILFRYLALFIACGVIAGCTAESKKARQLGRAQRYYDAGELESAKIAYLNVLRLDSQNPIAIQRLGAIWAEQGDPLRALPFLRKAKELQPGSIDTRIRLARTLVALADFANTRKETLGILQQAPDHAEAIVLLAEITRIPDDLKETEEALEKFGDRQKPAYHVASAALQLRKGDTAQAERELKEALSLDPKSESAHLGLGNFYAVQGNTAEAESELKIAADLGSARSNSRLRYAELKFQSGKSSEAVALANEMTKQAPDFMPAWRLLAQIAFSEKKYDDALAAIEHVLAIDPQNIEGRMVQSQVWLAKGEIKRGVEGLERVNQMYAGVPKVELELARAYLKSNNPAQASAALRHAVATNPDYTEAVLMLAELELQSGATEHVVEVMTELLRKRPKLTQAQLLLAAAYQSLGRLDDAAAVFRAQIQVDPRKSPPHFLLGTVLRQQGKPAEARASFEKAQELAPDNLLPTYQLVELDIEAKDFKSAMDRVNKQSERNQAPAKVLFLKGKIYAAQSQWDQAEEVLLKSLDGDPNSTTTYDLLISVYLAANKLPQALAQLENYLTKDPKNIRSLVLSALIYEKLDQLPKAKEAYERVLGINSDFVPALNNLSYLCSERLNQMDRAAELALRARNLQPNDPSIADTLGWIMYKKGDYQQAFALLQESSGKLSNVPEVQYHFGCAAYMMGQTDVARLAFQQAANAPMDFPGKAEARNRLETLAHDSGSPQARSQEELENRIKSDPSDVMALMDLGQLLQKNGSFSKAEAIYEQALKLNPKLVPAMSALAEMYSGPLKNPAKALEIAERARALAPSDPKVARITGKVVFENGDYSRAYTLLQEGTRQIKNDPALLRELAYATYYLGRVEEARETMKQMQAANPEPDRMVEAVFFLAVTPSELTGKEAVQFEGEAEKRLKANPADVPALMVRGRVKEENGADAEAVGIYSDLLRRFPEFAPAQKRLAALYLKDPQSLSKAYDLAVKARKSLPDDMELAESLAEISYAKKEFGYARDLLQTSRSRRPLSAKSLYLLGMSCVQMGDKNAGRAPLSDALAAGLGEPMANEARKVLGEAPGK